MFLEGNNWNGWTDRQWHIVPERQGIRVKSSCACVRLDPGDSQTDSFAWSQWTGWEWWGKHGGKINRLLFIKRFLGQQPDLEQYSKFYWQPVKGTKQWNIVSEKWFCYNKGQSILNTRKFGEVSVRNTIQKWIAIFEMTGHKQLQVILHYAHQGDRAYAADPAYGKAWAIHRRHMRVEGEILLTINPRFRADLAGSVLTPKHSIGNIMRNLLCGRSFPKRRNSFLSGFSFSLFIVIHDWTEAKHDCKLFSAVAEAPDAKETYSWLSSA